MDVRELPEDVRAAVGSSAMLAFKYHQQGYTGSLSLARHNDHAVLAAIAEQGELVTVLSRQGELLTRASYVIKANKKQFLEVLLPDNATLWSCLVSNKSVKPVEGKAGKLLIPLDATTDSASTVPVELVYFERHPKLSGIGRLDLHGPLLDVPTTVVNWLLYAPSDVKFLRLSGTMDKGAAAYAFLTDPFTQVAYAQTASGVSERGRDMLDRLNFKAGRQQWQRQASLVSANGDEASTEGALEAPAAPPSLSFEEMRKDFDQRLNETGILPLKIQLPASGRVQQFHRLMTTNEALQLHATFVHLPLPQVPWVAAILILGGVGGTLVYRQRFAK